MNSQLNLEIDLRNWWQQHSDTGPVQRFTDFLRDVVLVKVKNRIVIFVDEIDTTLKLDFSDDFFAAIRAIYNARATDSTYNRLTFVLLGVAMPSDLIKDRKRTPFNIGEAIDLCEFSRRDASALEHGMETIYPDRGRVIFARIYYWTNGHPYLTQKLCSFVASIHNRWTDKQIEVVVQRLFLSDEARRETNLRFVRASVKNSPQKRQLLKVYSQIHAGKSVPEDERSLIQNELKLFGLVRVENGHLKTRNKIYHQAFNQEWIKNNMPVYWPHRLAYIAVLAVIVLAAAIAYNISREENKTADALAQSFRDTSVPEQQLGYLVDLVKLEGQDHKGQAYNLFFNELDTDDERLAIFSTAAQDPGLEEQAIVLIEPIYVYLDDTDEHYRLLEEMKSTLTPGSPLEREVVLWLKGRDFVAEGNDDEAVVAFNIAIDSNDLGNPAVYFDRALSYIRLEEYEKALDDLEDVLLKSTQLDLPEIWSSRVESEINKHNLLYTLAWEKQTDYERIAQILPKPTLTPTPTVTKEPTTTPISPTITLTATLIPLTATPILPTVVFIAPETDSGSFLIPTPTPPLPTPPLPIPGTSPINTDTDGDSLIDREEIYYYRTDPLYWDTDGDGLSDGEEIYNYGTSPLHWDGDGDGLSDGEEIYNYGTSPLYWDEDGDDLSDGEEIHNYGTSPFYWDTDGDDLSDGDEIYYYGTAPLYWDTDGDGLSDGDESYYGTDPLYWDTDGDDLSDWQEVVFGTDPLTPNSESQSIQEPPTPTTETVLPTRTAFPTASPIITVTPIPAP